MDDMRQRLGAKLKALRLDLGITQEQLAERAALHPTFIAKLETGRSLPSLPTLRRLASALEVPATRIVAGIDDAREGPKEAEDHAVDRVIELLQECLALLKRHRVSGRT